MLNKCMLIGRLTGDPQVKYTPAGQAVTNFSLATNMKWKDKQGQMQEKVEFSRIVVWGKLAELCGNYLAKGRQAYVEGRLETRKWKDKEGVEKYTTEIIAQDVKFLGSKDDNGGAPKSAKPAQTKPAPDVGFSASDIPF